MNSQKYVCGSRKRDLCICEKLLISRADLNVLLNKRDELVSKYRHRIDFKFTLKISVLKIDRIIYTIQCV